MLLCLHPHTLCLQPVWYSVKGMFSYTMTGVHVAVSFDNLLFIA